MSENWTIDDALSTFLVKFRIEHRLSLTQIADAAKRYGADWGSAGVRRIERGEAALTLEKLLQLALALRYLGGQALSLNDLLGDAPNIAFRLRDGKELVAPRSWIAEILAGEKITPPVRNDEVAFDPSSGTFMTDYTGADVIPEELKGSGYVLVVPTSAEQRAASKLGVTPHDLSIAARQLWQLPLDEEARERAGADASPQARGRVTRILMDELRDHFRSHSEKQAKDG